MTLQIWWTRKHVSTSTSGATAYPHQPLPVSPRDADVSLQTLNKNQSAPEAVYATAYIYTVSTGMAAPTVQQVAAVAHSRNGTRAHAKAGKKCGKQRRTTLPLACKLQRLAHLLEVPSPGVSDSQSKTHQKSM